jgi:hypothetical protein
MSGITTAGGREERFARPAAVPAVGVESGGAARRSGRLSVWRRHRRATRFERQAARNEWAAQIPVWAFGILHRGG